MFYVFRPEHAENYDSCCHFAEAFSVEECELIIEICSKLPQLDATVGTGSSLPDESIRKSKLRWIYFSEETSWLFKKLEALFTGANRERYQFSLTGLFEGLQYTEYDSSSSHYTWHQDHGSGSHSQRKLSLVIQLSCGSSYEGGDLEIFGIGPVARDRGTAIIFPSYEQHRVLPVTDGFRRSLVVWAAGPSFR